MSSYYGVTRSSEYLAHYGVKGMKWGVRKAKETGNSKALDRHWRKANRKLNRLNKKANWDQQKRKKDIADYATAYNQALGLSATAGALIAKDKIPANKKLFAYTVGPLAATLASTPSIIKSANAKKRLLPEGHKKAVNDAQVWAKEMNRVFHKTKYQGKTKPFSDTYERRTPIAPGYAIISKVTGDKLASNYAKTYGKKRRRT